MEFMLRLIFVTITCNEITRTMFTLLKISTVIKESSHKTTRTPDVQNDRKENLGWWVPLQSPYNLWFGGSNETWGRDM